MFRSLAFVAALSVASVSAAQTVADPQVSADALRQVRSFESALRKAIENAGSQLGERARAAVPDVQLRFQADPYAQGIILPTGEGIIFMVEVPGIDATSAMLFEQLLKLALQQQQQQQASGARPVTGVVPSPPPNLSALLTEPENVYRDLTHQALIDAMLDSAFTLPLKEGQTLTVSAGTLNPNPNPLDPVLRRLYLTIKAEDLIAFRANKINRDEAKSRIIEKRY